MSRKKLKCDTVQNCRQTPAGAGNSRIKVEATSLFSTKGTPPSFHKIRNPFETGLTESLHLPLICSPSLFQRPRTPGHFEWTIDDVSSLNPVNVEPNETQFQSISDPELDARAQAAITSYFKEQPVVPSPIDCVLRKQNIRLLSDIDKSAVKKNVRRIRDSACQTEVTLPPSLPEEIEKILNQYRTYVCNQQQSPVVSNNASITSQDISLRRKLFEYSIHPDDDADVSLPPDVKTSSPAPTTPELNMPHTRSYSLDSLNIRDKREEVDKPHQEEESLFFGSLSPIAKYKVDSITKSLTEKFVDKIDSVTQDRNILNENNDSICARSTPENVKQEYLSRLLHKDPPKALDCKEPLINANSIEEKPLILSDSGCPYLNIIECLEMQISQSSTKSNSSSSSSQNACTPMRKRRSPSRKNLSRSFSCHYSDSDNDNDKENNLVVLNKSISIGFPSLNTEMELNVKWL